MKSIRNVSEGSETTAAAGRHHFGGPRWRECMPSEPATSATGRTRPARRGQVQGWNGGVGPAAAGGAVLSGDAVHGTGSDGYRKGRLALPRGNTGPVAAHARRGRCTRDNGGGRSPRTAFGRMAERIAASDGKKLCAVESTMHRDPAATTASNWSHDGRACGPLGRRRAGCRCRVRVDSACAQSMALSPCVAVPATRQARQHHALADDLIPT